VKRKSIFIVFAALILVLAACGGGGSGSGSSGGSQSGSTSSGGSSSGGGSSGKPIEIKFGTAVGPASPIYEAFTYFKDEVEKRSDGRLTVTIYDSGSLGGERELAESVQLGNLEMAIISSPVLGNFEPDMSFFDLPYLVKDYDEMAEFLKSPVMDEMNRKLIARGMRPLGWASIEFKQFNTNVRPVRTPEDVRGLKIRTQENNFMPDYYRSMGASPTPIPLPEVYSSLQQGIIDSYDNGPLLNISASLFEQTKYISVSNHFAGVVGYMIGEGFYQSLPDDLKGIVDEVGRETASRIHEIAKNTEVNGLKDLAAKGIEVIYLTDAEKAKFMEYGKPLYEKAKTVLTPEFYELVDRQLGLSSR